MSEPFPNLDETQMPRYGRTWGDEMREALIRTGFEVSRSVRHYQRIAELLDQAYHEFEWFDPDALDAILGQLYNIATGWDWPEPNTGFNWISELWENRGRDYPLSEGPRDPQEESQ